MRKDDKEAGTLVVPITTEVRLETKQQIIPVNTPGGTSKGTIIKS